MVCSLQKFITFSKAAVCLNFTPDPHPPQQYSASSSLRGCLRDLLMSYFDLLLVILPSIQHKRRKLNSGKKIKPRKATSFGVCEWANGNMARTNDECAFLPQFRFRLFTRQTGHVFFFNQRYIRFKSFSPILSRHSPRDLKIAEVQLQPNELSDVIKTWIFRSLYPVSFKSTTEDQPRVSFSNGIHVVTTEICTR